VRLRLIRHDFQTFASTSTSTSTSSDPNSPVKFDFTQDDVPPGLYSAHRVAALAAMTFMQSISLVEASTAAYIDSFYSPFLHSVLVYMALYEKAARGLVKHRRTAEEHVVLSAYMNGALSRLDDFAAQVSEEEPQFASGVKAGIESLPRLGKP
jgi:hypothetical protein